MRFAAAGMVLAALLGAGGYALWQQAQSRTLVVLSGATMGTTFSIKFVGRDTEETRSAVRSALDEATALFSTYEPDSEISRFNALRSTEPVDVSPRFMMLVLQAQEIAIKTEGAFDPTLGPLVALYGFTERETRKPKPAELEAVLARVGYKKLETVDGKRLRKSVPELELDLNALAKGWGVDRVIEMLDRHSVRAYMVEIGGEVRCAGVKPDGQPWKIGIEEPPADGEPVSEVLEVVELTDAALATSGTYRNVLGETHHILEGKTGGNPSNRVVSVSVRASTCALADGLATALVVAGPDKAERFLGYFTDPKLSALMMLRGEDGKLETRKYAWR